MNIPDFSKALLSRRDSVYLLSLLIPFVIYRFALNALYVASLPGDHSLYQALELVLSDIFFSLGYALLWIGLFAVVKKRPLRWVVVFLFHFTTILVLIVFTFAYQYFHQNGTTLEYGTFAAWIPKLDEAATTLFQSVSPLAQVLFLLALFYVTLGPWLLMRTVTWWRGWQRRSPTGIPDETSLLSPLVLCLLGLGFGSLSVLITTTALAKDPFINVITTGVEEATTQSKAEEATTKEDNSDPGIAVKAAAHASLAQTPQTEKRNVVLVHLESTRAQSVTPYNEDLKTTPFLNELVKNSLLVEQAHVGSIPRSSMSNVSVNCGIQPPPRPGPDEPGSMPVPCLAGLLRDQGYSTAFFSSNADAYGELATKNWGYESAFAPPGPSVPSQYWDTSMDPEKFMNTSHYGYEEDIMLGPSERWLKEHKDKPLMAEYLTNTGHDEYRCLGTRYGSENFSDNDLLNHYLNCLRLQDIFLQNLFEQYKELGLYDNTIFILFGDHGEGFGEHGRFMHGDTIWEEGLKVPLIIHAPAWFKNGERVDGLSNYTDILPTVLEMLGFEVKDGKYPGYSLLHSLPEDRTLMFSCISRRKCMASIQGNEKYIYHYDNQPEEVFDLSKDPLEEHNLAGEYNKEDLDKRRKDLFAWLSSIDAQYGHGALLWGDQSEENTRQQDKHSREQSTGATVGVGQPLRVGDLEWIVTNAYPVEQLISPIDGGTRQGNFVVVDFQIKNNSNEGIDLSSQSLALFDGNGRKFKFDTDTYLYIEWSKVLFRFEVGPGDSQEGEFIFKVVPDISQFRLQLGERNPFSNERGYVNLGF